MTWNPRRFKRFSSLAQLVGFIANHPLTRDRKAAAFARLLSWQVRSRFRGEIIVPWVGNTRLAARRGMTGATGNIYTGLHEFADMAFALHFLRPGDLFADIGANIGSYTILASGVCGADAIAFEPDPDTMRLLRRNVEVNGLSARVQLAEVALGREVSEVEFTVGLDSINRVTRGHAGPTRRVPMRTLDGMTSARPPNLIKIDVEGHEGEVFHGSVATLHSPSLKAIITEGQDDAIVATIREAGFQQYVYDPFQRKLSRTEGYRTPNALFLRDEPFVTARVVAAPAFRVIGAAI